MTKGLKKRERRPLAPAYTLTHQQWRWVEEFLLSADLHKASVAAAYSNTMDLRGDPKVRDALAQAQMFRSSRTAIRSDFVLQRWWALATADVNEIVELRVGACRRCWGRGHMYQFRDHELGEAQRAHDEAMLKRRPEERVELNELGGPGYTTKKEPHPGCPACDGDGEPHVVFKDTRKLSAGARIMYNGVERKKDGSIKMLLRDRGFAETMLAKHLGLLPSNKRMLRIEDMSEEELDEFLTANGVNVYVAADSPKDDARGEEADGLEPYPELGDPEAPDALDPEPAEGLE